MKVTCVCSTCGNEFTLMPSQVKQGRGKYCSYACHGLANRTGSSYVRNAQGPDGLEHRRVWIAAHGPIPEGYVIHHINENRRDNRLENLELLTKGEHNTRHKKGHGGEGHAGSTLTDAIVQEIRSRYAAGGISQWQLSYEYPCSRSAISKILSNRTWRHLL